MAYPASISVETPERIARWRPLVHWLLAIPHLFVFSLLQYVAWLLNIVAWFAIVITGRMPAGLAGFQCMYLRYTLRLYAYLDFVHEQYPPFEFNTSASDLGGTAVTVNFEPQLTDRNRGTVAARLILAIPAVLFWLLSSAAAAIVILAAFFFVLLVGRWPAGLRNWLIGWYGVVLRTNAYLHMLTDEYPPFSFDAKKVPRV